MPGVAIATASAAIVALILKTVIGERLYHVVDNYKPMIMSMFAIIACSVATLLIPHIILRSVLVAIVLILSCLFFRREIADLTKVAISFIKRK